MNPNTTWHGYCDNRKCPLRTFMTTDTFMCPKCNKPSVPDMGAQPWSFAYHVREERLRDGLNVSEPMTLKEWRWSLIAYRGAK